MFLSFNRQCVVTVTDPEAAANSRICRRCFVRRKSAEKIRLADFVAEFYQPKIRRKNTDI